MAKRARPSSSTPGGGFQTARGGEQRTIAELQTFTPEQWRDWFRDGVRQWFGVREDDDGVVRDEPAGQIRREAFLPVTMSARSQDAAGELATSLLRATRGKTAMAANGLGLLIQGWQVASDGAEAAAFVIALANSLATPDLVRNLIELFKRPLAADARGRRRLIGEAVNAARDRGSAADATELATLMAHKGWMEPIAAARVLPRMAGDNLYDLAMLIVRISPELASVDVDSPEAKALARAMRYVRHWKLGPQPAIPVEGYAEARDLLATLRGVENDRIQRLPGDPRQRNDLDYEQHRLRDWARDSLRRHSRRVRARVHALDERHARESSFSGPHTRSVQ